MCVVENFRPDVKSRLGFDYETLKAKNPRIILTSISAFGQDGPYRDRPGVDQVVQGMSGLMSVTGEPGRGPMRVGIPISDIVTGLFAANGILTALLERDKSGEGQWVQTSLLESQTFMLDLQAARYLVDGVVPKQVGNEHPSGVPTNAYKTKDGYVNVAPIPSMWPRLCKALGREEWIDDPDFRDARGSPQAPQGGQRRDCRHHCRDGLPRRCWRSSTPPRCPAARSTRSSRPTAIRRPST